MENKGTGVERGRLALMVAAGDENTKSHTVTAVTQTTSAAMIHPARIEELYFSKRVQRKC